MAALGGAWWYVAEGLVYVLIGAFGLVAALEPSAAKRSYKGAFAKLAAAPFGHAMLALLALGLAAFVLWQVCSMWSVTHLTSLGRVHGVAAGWLVLVVAQILIDHFSERRANRYFQRLTMSTQSLAHSAS
jgi:hypothetical protein